MNFRATFFTVLKLAGFASCVTAFTAVAQTAASFGNLPLYFEAGSAAQFIARGSDAEFSISPAHAQFALRKSDSLRAVQMQFIGANPNAKISGGSEFSGKINYLTGNDPAQWRSQIPTFAQVCVGQIYSGINLIYYGNQRQLEYDFTIAPGANPNAIAIRFEGADKISVNAGGELILKLGGNEIIQPAPEIYQTAKGARKEISGGYKILDDGAVAFSVGKYDSAQPLVIDPILSYSTYFGGTLGETAWAIALDKNDRSIYVAGETFSQHFTTNNLPFSTPGAFQTNFAGGKLTGDAFVAKFDNSGTNLIYLTYLGGSADDGALSVAVDNSGNAYLTGFTDSPNFPVANRSPGGVSGIANSTNLSGTFNQAYGSYPVDAFVAELNTNGSELVYSTYLGGSSMDAGLGIAVDNSGNAYVAGYTYSTNFPTANAVQNRFAATNSFYNNANAFVAEISSGGGALVFSTYLGGTNFDEAKGIAVDASGYIYVTGFTSSTNFPATNFISQTFTNLLGTNFYRGSSLGGAEKKVFPTDAFVTKYNPSGNGYVYSTYLGGTNDDIGNGIAADAAGCAYVTGSSDSPGFPFTLTNYSFVATNTRVIGLVTNAFLTKIGAFGTNIIYSTLFGGGLNHRGGATDVGNGVAIDALGNAFVIGTENSTNFPIYNNSGFLRSTNSGGKTGTLDVFVTAFNTNASALLYSVLLGGAQDDYGYGIAVDAAHDAYIVGQTLSTNFPTLDAFQAKRNGTNDAFLAEIVFTATPPQITTEPTNQLIETGSLASFVTTATGSQPLIYQWQLNGTNLMNGTNRNGSTISGATNATLFISDAQTNDSGNYFVIITNVAGSVTSSVAVLTVTSAPFLTTQPTNQTVVIGSTATFNINGFATPPYFLQWLKDGTGLTNGTNASGSIISGSSSPTLTISNVQTNDEGNYSVALTNNWGATTSLVATLTVLLGPSFTSIAAANDGSGDFILNGFGGKGSGTYFVLTSTNLATPLDLWTPIATNQFGSQGQFIFTTAPVTNAAQQFYLLQMPSP